MDYKEFDEYERSELLEVAHDIMDVLLRMEENQTKLLEAICNKSTRS